MTDTEGTTRGTTPTSREADDDENDARQTTTRVMTPMPREATPLPSAPAATQHPPPRLRATARRVDHRCYEMTTTMTKTVGTGRWRRPQGGR
jgi:hypothetical protein